MPKGKNYFNQEEIQQLEQNAHVRRVSKKTVSFTEEFTKKFYNERMNGKRPEDIFAEHGIDPELLGESRVKSYDFHTRRNAQRETGFTDERKLNRRRPRKPAETDADRITQLEHELAYTRQEVEFLKKLLRQIWRLGSHGNRSTGRSKVLPDQGSCFKELSPEHLCPV